MPNESRCIAAVRLRGQTLKALEVRIKGEDIYANCFNRDGSARAHGSYHASGQKHTKVPDKYVYWTGGPSGGWQPMKFFKPPPATVKCRERVWVIGWQLASLRNVLPPTNCPPDILVSADDLHLDSVVGIEVSVVGGQANVRCDILGFPILLSHRFSNGTVTVEIEVFHISEHAVAQSHDNSNATEAC